MVRSGWPVARRLGNPGGDPLIERATATDRAFLAMDLGDVPEQFGVLLLLDSDDSFDLCRVRAPHEVTMTLTAAGNRHPAGQPHGRGALADDAEDLLEPGNDRSDGLPVPGCELEQEEHERSAAPRERHRPHRRPPDPGRGHPAALANRQGHR